MYVRDHQRPVFHKALGVDPDWYAHEVYIKTSEMTKQIFPITLDIENPRWQRGLEKLQKANLDLADAVEKGQVLRKLGAQARAGMAFVSLFTIPALKHECPASVRMAPAY